MRFKSIPLIQGSQPWLDYRKGRIGASDIPAICSVSGAYNTRSNLLYEKITGISEPVSAFTQALFDKGHEIEIEARDGYNKTFQTNYTPAVVQSIDNELFFASLDGMDETTESIMEVKSTMRDEYLNLAMDNKIPDVYNYQIQWQLFITGFNQAVCVVVDSRDRIANVVHVVRNDSLIEEIKTQAEAFLKVMSVTLSPYVQIETKEIRTIAATMEQVRHYKKLIKQAEKEINEQAENLLKQYNALSIEGAGVVIDYQERIGSVQYDLIPELKNVDLNKYRKESTKSVRIKEKKVKELE